MRYFVLLSLLTFISFSNTFSQMPTGRPGGGATQNTNMGHFYGKIVDKQTGKGIEGATVLLVGSKFDPATKKMKEANLKTLITESNGDFSLEDLPIMGKFKLKISAIGYKAIEQPVAFDFKPGGDRTAMMAAVDKDLGNIKLEQDAANLGNVVVTSTKQMFELGIDRKIFNVDKNLVSTGQSATEIMRNIPSVNVDIDGNVTLRNAAPTIFVDGRPTTLTLDQIPADIIDKVELITNPSAKYDASGGNAGIINIVLKKNKKTGYNGGLRSGIDSRGRVNIGGDINFRQRKVNMFLSGTYNQRKSITTGSTERNNFTNPLSNIFQDNNGTSVGYFGFIRGGLDFFIDNRNTISVAGSFNRGKFDSEQDQQIDSIISNAMVSYSDIATLSEMNFKNFGSTLSYKHNFAKNGHELTADINYNSSNNDNLSLINTQTFQPNSTPKYLPLLQQTLGDGYNRFLTIQTDYENPITDNSKIEAGARVAIRNFRNDNEQYFFNNGSGKYELLPTISSNYKFTDQVYAAYVSYSLKHKAWSYQFGLRAESSNYDGTLIGRDSAFNVKFPLSLFPSAFITNKISDKEDLQFNYSRRINRPNFFQLMPFIDYTDPQNLNVGNAGLTPEFTNSFEFSYNNAYKKGANFLATIFYKQSDDLITRFQYKEVSPLNSADSAIFNTYVNANNSQSYGIELTNKISVTKWWDLTVNANLFNSKINGNNIQTNLSNERVSWFAKMNNNFKLKKGVSIQLSGDYQAKTVLPQSSGGGGGGRGGGGGGGGWMGGGAQVSAQGYIPRYAIDIAIRKDWTWKNGQSGSLTLSMNDIFRTQLFKTYSESIYFTQISQRRRDPQVLRLNFNYRFGKFDVNLFKRKNTKGEQGGGMDMMGQ